MRLFTYIFFLLFLATCGGGGGGSSPTEPTSSIITQPHSVEIFEVKTFNLVASSSLGESITFSIASQPTGGQVTINGSEATYNPNSGFYGLDSFTITATSASSSEIIPINIDVFNNPYKDYEISDITAISTTYENDELDGSYTNYSCMYNGVERNFSVFVPNGINPYKINELPLYMYFHGSNGVSLPSNYIDRVRTIRKYNDKLIYVRPQGLPGNSEEAEATGGFTNARGFNYYYPGWREDNDDVGFTNALINYIHKNYSVTHNKIVIGGFSTGGSFVPVMGSENELIDGVIQGAGMMHTYYTYTYEQPIKYHVWKGTEDGYHPYGYDEDYPTFWGINEALAMFSDIKSCNDATNNNLPDLNSDGHLTEKYNIDCYDGSSFNGYKMWEWGHVEVWGLDHISTAAHADVNIFQMLSEILN
jgi:poly(3-hydroxybutyrate) depolymerase